MKTTVIIKKNGDKLDSTHPKPEISLYGEQAEKFFKEYSLEPDKVYEGTIQFQLAGWHKGYGGNSGNVTLCVLGLEDVEESGEATKEKESDSEGEEDEGKAGAVIARGSY